jgi:hypothetical protein
MDSKTIFTAATVLALGASATTALARNWLSNEPDTTVTAAGASKLTNSWINYGPRARVRVYRPDGVYDVRKDDYELSPAILDGADTQTDAD